jgi:hypothetical protein
MLPAASNIHLDVDKLFDGAAKRPAGDLSVSFNTKEGHAG